MASDAPSPQKITPEKDRCPFPNRADAWNKLTPLQRAVVLEARTGAKAPEIASRLGISATCVWNRLSRAYRNLGINSRKDLIRSEKSGRGGIRTSRPVGPRLTPAQKLVVAEASKGSTHQEIASKLEMPVRSVRYRLRSACRKLGITNRKQLITHPFDKLSPFQRRVALLVSQGDANRHIISKLGVTENNLTRTLDKIYTKLGVNGRLFLIVDVLSHQPPPKKSARKYQQYYQPDADLLQCFGIVGFQYSDRPDSEVVTEKYQTSSGGAQ